MTFDRLPPEYDLPSTHPLASRSAYRCKTCGGLFYPGGSPTVCPYCEDEDDDGA